MEETARVPLKRIENLSPNRRSERIASKRINSPCNTISKSNKRLCQGINFSSDSPNQSDEKIGIANIPVELLVNIFSRINLINRQHSLALVSKSWKQILETHKLLQFTGLPIDVFSTIANRARRQHCFLTNYLRFHPQITESMRVVLVEWLFDVACDSYLESKTFQLAVHLLDRYLSQTRKAVPKDRYQHIGITSLMIAQKLLERDLDGVEHFSCITDYSSSTKDIVETEKEMLALFGFDIGVTTYQDMFDYFKIHWMSKLIEKQASEEFQGSMTYFGFTFNLHHILSISDPLRVFCASISASLYVLGNKDIWPEFLKLETGLDLSDFGQYIHELLALKSSQKNVKHPKPRKIICFGEGSLNTPSMDDYFSKKPQVRLQVLETDLKRDYEIVDKSRRHAWEVKHKYSKNQFMLKKLFKKSELEDGIPQAVIRDLSSLLSLPCEHIVRPRELILDEKRGGYVLFDPFKFRLKDLIEIGDPLDLTAVKNILYQLLLALQFCHDHRIMHRDVKPANIFIYENGFLKLANFSLSREFYEKEHTYSTGVVTLWYRPPEIILGSSNYSSAVDIWAAGCIFAEMILKKPLFAALTEISLLSHIFKLLGTPDTKTWIGIEKLPKYSSQLPQFESQSLSNLFQGVSPTALDLLSKMLVCDPGKRISAKEALKHPFFSDVKYSEKKFSEFVSEAQQFKPRFLEKSSTYIPTAADAAEFTNDFGSNSNFTKLYY